jgi:two-component system, cell cycle response regulator CpdR
MARILLADDDAATRDFVKRSLEGAGFEVQATQDGAEALEHLVSGTRSFDLLVTDVQMPLMDGITLAEKALELMPGLRIVLMSGYSEQLDRAKKFRAAKLATITKPFSLDQIRTLVKQTLA